MPFAIISIIVVEALSTAALRARPVFKNHATVNDSLYAAGSGELPLRVHHIPLAYPEIELLVFRRNQAGRCRSRHQSLHIFEARILAQTRKVRVTVQLRSLHKACVDGSIQPLKSL